MKKKLRTNNLFKTPVREKGMAFMMVMILLLVAVPLSIVAYRMVNQSLRMGVRQAKQQTAVQYANNAIMDFMRQFSDDQWRSQLDPADYTRPQDLEFDDGSVEFNTDLTYLDGPDRTILVEGTGKFGLAGNPDAKKRITALIKFESNLAFFANIMNNVDEFRAERPEAKYHGNFFMRHGVINGAASDVEFFGTLMVEGNFQNNGPAIIHGDLYVGGNLTPGGAAGQAGNVDGEIFEYIPEITIPNIDVGTYARIKDLEFTSDISIWFDGEGKYQTTEELNYFIDNQGNHLYSEGSIDWTLLTPAIGAKPNEFIILANNCNIGIAGTIVPRVTVVATGPPGSASQGNITIFNDIWYVDGSSVSKVNSSLALLAKNGIWIHKPHDGDVSIRGILYQETKNHIMVHGDKNGNFYFSGTRNARFILTGNSYNGGTFVQDEDTSLRKFPPPGLAEKPLLVSYRIH